MIFIFTIAKLKKNKTHHHKLQIKSDYQIISIQILYVCLMNLHEKELRPQSNIKKIIAYKISIPSHSETMNKTDETCM